MLANMDGFSKPYEIAPGVILRLLPFKPVYWLAQQATYTKYIKEAGIDWMGLHDIFILVCPLATSVCVEPESELTVAMQVFILWLNGRTGDIIKDWCTFEQMVDVQIANDLWSAFEATRDDIPKAPAILRVPAPIPVDENGNLSRPTKAGGRKSRTR